MSETGMGLEYEPTLYGWDDEKVYFFDESGVEWCVSDYPELLASLVEMCREHFRQEATRQDDGESE
jgi:hypothetical protein